MNYSVLPWLFQMQHAIIKILNYSKQWREANPKTEGNIRDAASLEQLVVLSNMESINAVLIHQNIPQSERLKQLNTIAITQMKSLVGNKQLKKLK